MVEGTETDGADGTDGDPDDGELRTSGYIERTVLHHLVGAGGGPTTVGEVLGDVSAVVRRGDYADVGPEGATPGTVRKSAVRRTLSQLHGKGLVRRVVDLDPSELREGPYDLGDPEGDPTDPRAYPGTSDDARVTDWVLTEAGRREVRRLDARYAAELDELAARYGRPPGETTDRIDG